MTTLDACIWETLRLRHYMGVKRDCAQDVTLTLPSGREMKMRKGDVLWLSPFWFHHDPEIYSDPYTFKVQRNTIQYNIIQYTHYVICVLIHNYDMYGGGS